MYPSILTILFIGLALTGAFPAPVPAPQPPTHPTSWQPAPSTTVTCAKSDLYISFFVGPQLDSVLESACAAMMPTCAYPPEDMICTQQMEWPLDGPKSTLQSANVVKEGNKQSRYQVKFSVTPGTPTSLYELPNLAQQVQWTTEDCYGYFALILANAEPDGCFNWQGSGAGSAKVGGTGSLKDTVFDVQIVERAVAGRK